MGETMPSPESTIVCRARAMRPLPSRKGWIMTRLRCAMAARNRTGTVPLTLRDSTSLSTRSSTSSASGRFIDVGSGFVSDPDVSRSIEAWPGAQIMLDHHEMKRLQKGLIDNGFGFSQLEDIGHSVPVAGKRLPCLCGCVKGLLSFDAVEHIVERGAITLDPVRPSDCPGKAHSPKMACPSSRLVPHVLGELAPQTLYLSDNEQIGIFRFWRDINAQ